MTGAIPTSGASLPAFRLHPDPVASGSVVASDEPCACCGSAGGYLYRGPIYGPARPEPLCPWCIGSGTAAERYGVVFTGLVERDDWHGLTEELRDEVLRRTPGFTGWQPERWLPHHGVPAVFLGPHGADELRALGDQAVEAVRAEATASGLSPGGVDDWMAALARDASPTAYVFRCAICGAYVGYSDDF